MTGSPGASSSPDAYPTRPGEDFDPHWLQTPATLNRTRLAAFPAAEADWVGRPAFELLGLKALHQLPATQAAEVFGRRLGHLVATLHQGLAFESGASEWRRAYLAYWSTIAEVWLGGGVAAALGEPMLLAARAEVGRLGAHNVAIQQAQAAAELPLIGAARSNHVASQSAVVLDFGHTAIKRAIAYYADGALARLDVLPALPAPTDRDDAPARVAEAMDATLLEAPEGKSREVVASVASYVDRDGTPAESHSRYALLRPGERLRLGHDGTLAASGVQPTAEPAAVIMLGTALGVGFAPPRDSLRAIAPGFEIRLLRGT